MALPFLPGNSFNKNLGKDKYHKSHYFDNNNEVGFLFGDNKPGIGGDRLPGQRVDAPNSRYPVGAGSSQPAWIAFDKQVLSFDCYYQEGVHEKREEQYRIHHCKLYFYLEDDSIQIIEARNKNSGLPQGTLVRRHRVSRPAPNDDRFYTVEDFNVGKELEIYGKVFKLTGCDEFTHNFLRKLGVRVEPPSGQPLDPYSNYRKTIDESMQPLRPYERHDALRQFLDHDRQVLRFYCFWDDSGSLFGDPREMVLHYFLADDTIEIREVIRANCGRDAASCFLRRQKLPKNLEALNQPGAVADRTVLNVFGRIQDGRYILDNLKTGAVNLDFYTDQDLTIGSYLNIWGRKFLIRDCDDFTKEYYRTKYGIAECCPVEVGAVSAGGSGVPLTHEDPPYNGWGSEEDSLLNCKSFIMETRPMVRDFIQFMEKDRRGFESHVLRFLARLDTDRPVDNERRFIISYFLADDTMLVFESAGRNTGITGGKFLEKQKIKAPGHEQFSTKPPVYYQAADLYVGAKLKINKFDMVVEDADEYAYRYMETHPSEFPNADIGRILSRIRRVALSADEMRAFFARNDPDGTNTVPYELFKSLVAGAASLQGQLTEHEIITLGRHYAVRASSEVNPSQVFAAVQQLLRKVNFEAFSRLREAASHADRDGRGTLPPERLRIVCRTVRLTMDDDLLRTAIQLCQREDSDQVCYETFIKQINWKENPLPPIAEFDAKFNANWTSNEGALKVDRIQWDALVNDIAGCSE